MPAVVHLAAHDGLIEAASRLRSAPVDDELVLAVPEDAPVLANPLFLRTLRELRPASRLVLVTSDARGRAFASGAHLPAYASLAAYEEKTVDPTERLERARLAALADIGRERSRQRRRAWRIGAVGVATLVLLLAVAPSAQVVVAADATAMAPIELQVVAGPSAPVRAARLRTVLNSSVNWSTVGARTDTFAATGIEKLTNASTDAIDIKVGFIVSTSGGIQFKTTEARHLEPSRFFPLVYSSTSVPIEAAVKGTTGNVGRNTITRVANGDRRLYVTNEQPTSGGEEKRVAVVAMSDYTAGSAALDKDIATKTDEQLRAWSAGVAAGSRLEATYAARTVARTSAGEVLQKEVESFFLSATIEITTYAVPEDEPRATALRRLGEALKSEHELVPSAIDIETTATTVTDDGVTWRITARASERPRVDGGSVQAALAGQDRATAARVLEGRGILLRELRMSPSWWPRLPLVPLRIEVRSAEQAASGP